MARHSGKNLLVRKGTDVLDGVRGFDIEETVDTIDLTAAGDTAQAHTTGIPGWSGTISMLADHDPTANQNLRAGDSIEFEGYTEGNASGKSYVSGTATVTSMKVGATHDGEVTREYSIQGNGALSIATVSP